METTNFSAGTVITSDWLNEIDRNTYDDCINVKNYGAVGNDSTDDTDAIEAAITAAPSSDGAIIYFPPGRYKVTRPLIVTKSFIVFAGAGPRVSEIRIYHDDGYGLTVEHATTPGTSYQSGFVLQNMGLRAMVDTTGNACLKLNKVQDVYFSNVNIQDHFGGVDVLGGLNLHWNNITIKSAAATLWSVVKTGSYFLRCRKDAGGVGPVSLYITNFNFRRNGSLDYTENGIIITAADGIWLSNGHIMGVDNADMYISPEGGSAQLTGIRCSNVWFDNNADYGIYVTGTSTAQFGDIELTGTRFLTHAEQAIYVDTSCTSFAGFVINGGVVHKAGTWGFLFRAGQHYIINGVSFAACNTTSTLLAAGIGIQQGVDKVTISNCNFLQTQATTTSAAMLGVAITSFATSQIIVTGCNFDLDSGVDDIKDQSTSDLNMYVSNITTKTFTLSTVTSGVLQLPETGDVFQVAGGLNFSNMTGRWHSRRVTLYFQGSSTVTHGSGGIRLNGSVDFSATVGDSLTLVYNVGVNDWIEASRMVA